MNAEQFTRHLLDPASSAQAPDGQLQGLVEQYPFCQHLRWLNWQSKKGKEPEEEAALIEAATYSAERDLLFSQSKTAPQPEINTPAVRSTNQPTTYDSTANVPADLNQSTLQPTKTVEKIELEEEVHYFEIPDRKVESLDWKLDWPNPTVMGKKNKQKNKAKAAEKLREELTQSADKSSVDKLKQFIQKPPKAPPAEEIVVEEVKLEKPQPKGRFSSWSRHGKVQTEKESLPAPAKREKKAKKGTKASKKATKKGKKHKKNKKIKQFAAASVKNNPALISETLAILLIQQGHHDKAIDMYEKLRLLKPEKSSFFANQIEKLKNL